MRWIKRFVVAVLALFLMTALLGAGYEAVARWRVARANPAPGRLVDIGGRHMHLDCRGAGAPVVVFESGLDTFGSLSWSKVQDSVAAFTRACAYDRAGIMWSDPGDRPQDARQVARDLYATLDAARESGPLVLVGHSLGGPYILTETALQPARVAGLVFVDASHPDQVARLRAASGEGPTAAAARLLRWAPLAARLGLVRLFFQRPPSASPEVPARAVVLNNAMQPRSIPGMVAEAQSMDSTMAEAGRARSLGDRPLVVLTALKPISDQQLAATGMTREAAGRMRAVWDTLHAEEAAFSTRSERIRLEDASHYIQFDRPDVVIGAIRSVVATVRGPKALGQ